ncbi:hypothetical protein ABFY48_08735 [Lysinibacillus pakistanensis]|uniref:hypothetical protein n=1 Tax=Lysinibacillus pakistanensis TaxID=759811 RepID=UPI003D2BF278
MGWKLNFHFANFPKIILCAFVTASNEEKAIEKFNTDYPNLARCIITEIIHFKH